jgi:hypothetical protein
VSAGRAFFLLLAKKNDDEIGNQDYVHLELLQQMAVSAQNDLFLTKLGRATCPWWACPIRNGRTSKTVHRSTL